jgi:hypothetical protein
VTHVQASRDLERGEAVVFVHARHLREIRQKMPARKGDAILDEGARRRPCGLEFESRRGRWVGQLRGGPRRLCQ